jgi:hypothetical protein
MVHVNRTTSREQQILPKISGLPADTEDEIKVDERGSVRASMKALFLGGAAILLLAAGCGGSEKGTAPADPPRILDTAPGDGTTGAGIHKPVTIVFDRAIDNASLDNATVTLSPNVPGTISCTGNVVRFQPAAALEYDRTYQLTIGGAVRDRSGVAMGSAFTISFRTSVIPIWEGSKPIASSADDYAVCGAGGASGNVYVAGRTRGVVDNAATNRGGFDLFVARYGPTGSRIWATQFGTAGDDNVTGVAVDNAGNVYACGFTAGGMDGAPSLGGTDAFVVKFDDNGARLWSRQFGTANDDFAFGIASGAGGGVYVTGASYGLIDNGAVAGGGADMMIARLDPAGNLLWVRQRGTPAADIGMGVAVDASGNGWACGTTGGAFDGNVSAGGDDLFLIGFDPAGSPIRSVQFGSQANDAAAGIALDAAGGIYVTGSSYGSFGAINAGNSDAIAARFGADGSRTWTAQFGSAGNDVALGTPSVSGGFLYLAGYTDGRLGVAAYGQRDLFLQKVDAATGLPVWIRQYGTSVEDVGTGVTLDAIGDAFLTGYSAGGFDDNPPRGANDGFLVKYRADGERQ